MTTKNTNVTTTHKMQ